MQFISILELIEDTKGYCEWDFNAFIPASLHFICFHLYHADFVVVCL